jgi:hypothetical protein
MTPTVGQTANGTLGSSATIARLGEQDVPLGGDMAFWDRAAYDADVQFHDGSVWHTKVWWTGARLSFHQTGPFFYRVSER